MLSLTVLLLVAVTGVLSASQVPMCTQESIDKVKAQWGVTGVPQNVTGFPDSFKTVGGSTSTLAKQGQCKTYKFTPGSLLDVTDNISLPCTESEGILTLEDSMSYVITYDKVKKVFTTLRCGKNGPKPTASDPVLVSIAAADDAKDEDVQKAFQDMTKLGFAASDYKCK